MKNSRNSYCHNSYINNLDTTIIVVHEKIIMHVVQFILIK